jgi:hypothetical protein
VKGTAVSLGKIWSFCRTVAYKKGHRTTPRQ